MGFAYAEEKLTFDMGEIKASKERTRESEAIAASVRNFQTKLCYLHLQNSPDIESDISLGIFNKANYEKLKKAKSYWNSTMSDERKRGLVKLRREELFNHIVEHFSFPEVGTAIEIFAQALAFAVNRKTWKFWGCCDCRQIFSDLGSYMTHLVDLHELRIDKDSVPLLPKEPDRDSVEEIVNGVWKPVNSDAAIKIIAKQLDEESGGCGCGLSLGSLYREDHPYDECKHGNQHLFDSICDKNISYMTSKSNKKWPLCDDGERTAILGRIRAMFQLLLTHHYLTQSHVWWVIQFTLDEFQNIIPVTLFSIHGLLKLKVIFFSGAPQLKNILDFLELLADTFGVSENRQTPLIGSSPVDIKERILLSGDDFTDILVDKRLLQGELNLFNYSFADAYDGSTVSLDDGESEGDVTPDSDEILPWLYVGLTVEEALEPWQRLIDSQMGQANRIYEIYKNELLHLKQLCERRREYLRRIDSLEADQYNYVILRTKIKPQYEQCSQASLFLKWQKQPTLESYILTHLEKGTWRMPSYENDSSSPVCNYIYESERKIQNKQLSRELLRYDAMIMHSLSLLSKYKLQLGHAAAYDYRSIMLPLLKSFLQTRLEDLIEKDDRKMFACDSKKNDDKIRDNMIQTTRKSQNGKKNNNNSDKITGQGTSGEAGAMFDVSESKDDVVRWRDEDVQIILDRIDQVDNKHLKLQKEVREMIDKISMEIRKMNDKISVILEYFCNPSTRGGL